jgi:hypothetical protein
MKAEVRRQKAEGIKLILQAFSVFLMVALFTPPPVLVILKMGEKRKNLMFLTLNS